MLYRGMDRAALDAAYDSGAAVADAPRYRADWAARSERMRARHAATMDIPYGDAPRAKLDLFLAASPPAPTLIFIHGGYWQMNQKENFAFIAEGPLAHGINVASLGYTLAPEGWRSAVSMISSRSAATTSMRSLASTSRRRGTTARSSISPSRRAAWWSPSAAPSFPSCSGNPPNILSPGRRTASPAISSPCRAATTSRP